MNYEERDNLGMYRTHRSNGVDSIVHKGPGPELMGANTLTGNDVYNKQDEDLGDISEIMIDIRSGRVSYAVLTFGSFLGMGGKLFAVPWEALQLDTKNKRFVLDVNKERLKEAPGFDKEEWPDMANPSWSQGIHAYYGTRAPIDPPAL